MQSKKGLNVLSVFDGISCGRVALERAGLSVSAYYASEIDKYAIKISKANYPDIVQLGDIRGWQDWLKSLGKIDLILAGFPCQSWSVAGKQEGDKSLFHIMLDVMRAVQAANPSVKFIIENVKMKKAFEQQITGEIAEALGITFKTLINSNLVSAQNRERYYWTNFFVKQPQDKGIILGDIVEQDWLTDREKSHCIDANFAKGGNLKNYIEKRRRQLVFKPAAMLPGKAPTDGGQVATASEIKGYDLTKRVYGLGGKSPTLNACTGGNREPKVVIIQRGRGKNQGGIKAEDGKTPTLTANYWEHNNHLTDGIYYRKLTPLECERLQTVLQYIKQVEIVLCSDQAKSFVDAVEKNPKLLKLVSSAESEELREYVRRANQSTSASLASTKHTALQNADMQIQTQTEKCTNINRDGLNLIASSVENTTTYEQVENVESSVTQTVFINITEGRITHHGKEESRLTEQNYTELMNGKIALNLCGGETMENAKDALSALEMMQTNQHSTSITSFRLSTKNIEQILIISYWFAKSAIDGFIQDTTNKKSLYLNLIDGYTAHVSNTQRYKAIGNGWTVDVIAHILMEGFKLEND